LVRRDDAFIVMVGNRMVLRANGKTLVLRQIARPLRHGPAPEDAVPFKAEIIMQPGCVMLLDGEEQILLAAARRLAARLRGRLEVAFFVIFFKRRTGHNSSGP